MSLSFNKIAIAAGLFASAGLLVAPSAKAFSVTLTNQGFENVTGSSPNSWNTIGDATTIGTIDGINPTNAIRQAIITTGYIDGSYSGIARKDDGGSNFNVSGTNPVSADTNISTLQNDLGINANAFSIPRNPATLNGVDLNAVYGERTSKEGSGLYQDFTVNLAEGESGFTVSFDWAYLTNDGLHPTYGEQDFAFWTLGEVNNGNFTSAFDNSEIDVLRSSEGPINNPLPTAGSGAYDYSRGYDYGLNARQTFSVEGLAPGEYTYRLGYGVVDVDGLESTSALLLDDIAIEEVPFEFTPTAGIVLVLGAFGLNKLRKNRQS